MVEADYTNIKKLVASAVTQSAKSQQNTNERGQGKKGRALEVYSH